MKKLKNCMALFLVTVMSLGLVLGVAPTEVKAEGTIGISFADGISCSAGETFSLTVNVSGNPGILSFGVTMTYPTDKLEYVSASKGSLVPSSGLFDTNLVSAGTFKAAWAGMGEVLSGDGDIFTVQFKALSDGIGTADISMVASGIKDANYTTVTPNCSGGTITITVPAHEHQWVEESRVEPTCTEAGSVKYTCSVSGCSETKTEEIAALGHDFSGDVLSETPATCTEAGVKTVQCIRCNETTDITLPALGHEWELVETTKKPTMTEEGKAEYKCSRCEETKTKTLPKIQPVAAKGSYKWANSDSAKDLTVVTDLPYSEFKNVYVDGKLLDAANYTLVENKENDPSTVTLELKAEYLATLSNGEHTLVINGENTLPVETTFTVSGNTSGDSTSGSATGTSTTGTTASAADTSGATRTGDASDIILWAVVMLCAIGVVGALVYKRKRQYGR